MIIRSMTIDDYPQVLELMRGEPGVSVRSADSPAAIARYLERNPGLSFVAHHEGRLVGCVFGSHDGRRGTLRHLVVKPESRKMGIGRLLVNHALDALQDAGIDKSLIDVFADNSNAIAFWERMGWEIRNDLVRLSFNRSDDPNA